MMRRFFSRLLRLRNLVILTGVVILLHLLKSLSQIELKEADNNLEHDSDMLRQSQDVYNKMEHLKYFVPSSLKALKNWHNYTQISLEKKRVGLGEQGLPASLPASEAKLEEKLYSVNGFNGALSDRIPLNRSLADIRHRGCKNKLYLSSLPTVSVVVPFHNEHWSTLLRTAYSVLYRAPAHLIKEVLLVDDASNKDFLGSKLDSFLSANMPKARVIRLPRRSGLITARLAGAKEATGDVLLFLDSHTEANVNFLPPLLDPIAKNYRTVVCPFIDVIAYDTFEYRAQDEGARGAFDWELFYKRLPVLPRDQANMPEPFESPVMAGGLFAISRVFFWELGGYDPGLDIWGGEQYELSFKIWQCGGRMIDAPCSRIGHIYRKFAPFPNPNRGDFVGKNYRRVAEVWMDEYKEHLYRRRPHYRDIDPGDLSAQRALRERLRCKSFRWFITQIAFDLPFKYPPVEPKPFAQGRIRPVEDLNLCIDARGGQDTDALTLRECAADAENRFILSWHKDIKTKSRAMCWDLPEGAPKSKILLYSCHLGGGNQLWRYHLDTRQLRQGKGNNCVEYDPKSHDLYINHCSNSVHQKWDIDNVDHDQMASWDSIRDVVYAPVEKVLE